MAVSCAARVRRIAVFTEANEVLRLVARQRGYTSNVWVDPRDFPDVSFDAAVVTGLPTAVTTSRMRTYLNMEQLATYPRHSAPEVAVHTNAHSQLPFAASVAAEFERFAKAHGLRSKLWIPASTTLVQKWEDGGGGPLLRRRSSASLALFNLGQVCDATVRAAVYGATSGGRIQPREVEAKLRQHMERHGFTTPLYAGLGSANRRGWKPRAGAVACTHDASNDVEPLYNLLDVYGGERLAEEMNRPAHPPEDLMLDTGLRLSDEHRAWVAANGPWQSRYWLTWSDAKFYGLAFKRGVVAGGVARKVELFNAEQLDVPLAAILARVGTP